MLIGYWTCVDAVMDRSIVRVCFWLLFFKIVCGLTTLWSYHVFFWAVLKLVDTIVVCSSHLQLCMFSTIIFDNHLNFLYFQHINYGKHYYTTLLIIKLALFMHCWLTDAIITSPLFWKLFYLTPLHPCKFFIKLTCITQTGTCHNLLPPF